MNLSVIEDKDTNKTPKQQIIIIVIVIKLRKIDAKHNNYSFSLSVVLLIVTRSYAIQNVAEPVAISTISVRLFGPTVPETFQCTGKIGMSSVLSRHFIDEYDFYIGRQCFQIVLKCIESIIPGRGLVCRFFECRELPS